MEEACEKAESGGRIRTRTLMESSDDDDDDDDVGADALMIVEFIV